MYESYLVTVENILQEHNQLQSRENIEDSSSRTCTSTNTSKSESNEQHSFITPIEDENRLCLLKPSHNSVGCATFNTPSIKRTDKTSGRKCLIREGEKRVNSALYDTMTLLEDNSLRLITYKYTDSSQRQDLQMSSNLIKMKHCETCGDLHNGSFASGRFCSSKCARTVGGIARKMQRLRSKNNENNARIVSKDKCSNATKIFPKMRKDIPFHGSGIATKRDHRTYSDWTWMTRSHLIENSIFHDQQHFQIAASLCSLENTNGMEKNEQANMNNEIPFGHNDNSIERLKGQHVKMDVASLLN